MPTRKPTVSQRRLLENLAAGRNPYTHVHGRSAHGGFNGTWTSCIARGWMTVGWDITLAGGRAINLPVPQLAALALRRLAKQERTALAQRRLAKPATPARKNAAQAEAVEALRLLPPSGAVPVRGLIHLMLSGVFDADALDVVADALDRLAAEEHPKDP
jgi:hypothetical protein